MNKEFTIKNNEHTFRIANMNAIELLSLQSQVSFENYNDTKQFFELMLEKIEVKCDDKWLPVKEKGRQIYYPANIENDLASCKQLVSYFMNDYLKPVFQESNV